MRKHWCLTHFLAGILFFAGAGIFCSGSSPSRAQAPATGTSVQVFTGQVVPLGQALEKLGVRLLPEAAPYWLGLQTADGKLYPLVPDDGARLFFQDARLRQRPMQLTGRLLAGASLLQVLAVHSLKNGQRYEVYYWCDICAIRRNYPGACECCGRPMELRETPAK